MPFDKSAHPYDGDGDMSDITWHSGAQPVQTNLCQPDLWPRQGDGLVLDALSMAKILDTKGEHQVLDALVAVNSKLDMKMEQLMRIMAAASETVQPVAKQISAPFKQKGTTNIVALFELSEGQTVAIYMHNPDSTPNKILPDDELVSWKWLLNKKDVTILVAPEKGRDLKLQVLSAHWSKRDALGAISKYKAGKAVNFNYHEKLVGEPILVTAPEEGVSPAPTPDPTPAPAPDPALAPEPDPAQVEALALLQSVIDGTASMDAALAGRLLAAHEKFAGGAEFDLLFEQASQVYADAMVAKARAALAT